MNLSVLVIPARSRLKFSDVDVVGWRDDVCINVISIAGGVHG